MASARTSQNVLAPGSLRLALPNRQGTGSTHRGEVCVKERSRLNLGIVDVGAC